MSNRQYVVESRDDSGRLLHEQAFDNAKDADEYVTALMALARSLTHTIYADDEIITTIGEHK